MGTAVSFVACCGEFSWWYFLKPMFFDSRGIPFLLAGAIMLLLLIKCVMTLLE